jgi:hypothetical protein
MTTQENLNLKQTTNLFIKHRHSDLTYAQLTYLCSLAETELVYTDRIDRVLWVFVHESINEALTNINQNAEKYQS